MEEHTKTRVAGFDRLAAKTSAVDENGRVRERRIDGGLRLVLDALADRAGDERQASEAERAVLGRESADLRARVAELRAQLARAEAERESAGTEAERVEALAAVRATRTWRMHDRLERFAVIGRLARR